MVATTHFGLLSVSQHKTRSVINALTVNALALPLIAKLMLTFQTKIQLPQVTIRIAAIRKRVTQFLSLLTLPVMVSSLHTQLVLAKLPSSIKKKVVASSASITS